MRRLPLFLAALVLYLLAGAARATTIVGPGNVTVLTYDTAPNLIVVDLNNPQTLAAGTYTATFFNRQMNFGAGSIQPLLLTSTSPTSYVTIALGAAQSSGVTQAFTATTFGGTNAFTLGATTTVYGGIYWAAGAPAMPVGYAAGGSSFVRYAGAAAPVVGNAIGGGATIGNPFARTYDFSISVEPVPEPSTAALLGLGVALLVRRRASRAR